MADAAASQARTARPAGRRRDWTPELLSLPALVAILAVMGFPLLYLLWMSLHRWSMVGFDPPRFIGLRNFALLAEDARFVEALGRTFWFTALGLASNLPLGLGIALLMHERFPGRSLCRALLILPMVATPAAMGLVWVIMLDPTLGIVRYLLGLIGVAHPPLWLSDPDLVVPTLVAVDAWMWTPMVALICIAGLAALPTEPFEAALVDGASVFQRFRYLTLPLMLPTLMVAAMLRIMDLLKLIDIVYVMTGGGPGHLSETLNLYNYLAALSYDKIGYGSAIALVLFAIVIACTLVLISAAQAGLVSSQRRKRLGFAVAGWTVTFVLIAPFLWMVLGSFKTTVDFLAYPPVFAFVPTLDNYRQVLADNSFLKYTLNSTIVAAGATGLGLLLGIPAAYALARWRRTGIGVVLLLARMAPGIAFLIPLFVMFLELKLVGSYASLIASHLIFTLPLTVWMMIGFIEAVPIEIEKAALIDGCSLIGVLLRIIVPLTAQGIAATGILAFIASWNNFLFALVLANENTKTLPVAVLGYIGYNSIQWGTLMAAATFITLPVLVLALCVQRYIVRGLVAGAVTG